MFTLIDGLPPFCIGIVATGEITASDYTHVLEPALDRALTEWIGVNLIMVFQTELKNFTPGAWLQDIKVNAKNFLKWNKLAMVDHNSLLSSLTTVFDVIAPGEARYFSASQLEEAKQWVSLP